MTPELHDLEALREYVRSGGAPAYLLFSGHTAKEGAVGKECLSQWYPAPFTVADVVYPTMEHFMMASKARLFGDEETAAKILKAPNPGSAKRFGREVRGFHDATWNEQRIDIIIEGGLAKFSQHPRLRDFLLSTGDRVLVEASPSDRIWGIGLAADDALAATPETWNGLNLLGFSLMQVRSRLVAGPVAD